MGAVPLQGRAAPLHQPCAGVPAGHRRADRRSGGGGQNHLAHRRPLLPGTHRAGAQHALPAHRRHPGQARHASVPQRQPAVCAKRRIPLPRSPGAPRDEPFWRAAQGGRAGRRRRHGRARSAQVPLCRIGDPGGAGPGHDRPVQERAQHAGTQQQCAEQPQGHHHQHRRLSVGAADRRGV
ncbi:hypothetical protein D3C72_1789380 [compost metagenome]